MNNNQASNNYHKIYVILLATILIAIDQLCKYLVRVNIPLHTKIVLIPDILAIHHSENTGAAFSLFAGNVEFLSVISVLAILFIVYYIFKSSKRLTTIQIIAWAMLLGGTTGNLIDRIVFKSVTDLWEILFINFPIFNMADIFIDIGALIIIFINLFQENEKSKQT